MASTLLVSARDPELTHLVDLTSLPFVERAVREVIPKLGVFIDHVPWPFLGRAARGAERMLSPGFITHYALRKHAVRRLVLDAIKEGFSQVVLLGAGFDMLGRGLPKAARVFEIDHEATLAAKRRALDGMLAKHITDVTVDLRTDSVTDALARSARFDPRADTVYVAEGLLMYLKPERVDAILADIAASPSRRRRLVLTVVTPDPRGRVRLHTQHRFVDLCMGGLDERFEWGVARTALPRFFQERGFALHDVRTTTELAGGLAHRLRRDTGEVVLVADDAVAKLAYERERRAAC